MTMTRCLLLPMIAFCGVGAMRAQTCQQSRSATLHDHPAYLRSSATRSDSIDILHTLIDLDLTPVDQGIIAAHTTLRFAPKVNGIDHLPLDLLALTVDSVTYNGGLLTYAQVGEVLDIQLDAPHGPTDTLELTVHYRGDPTVDASGWGGFYTSGSVIYNLGVAFDAQPHSYGRAWFPCFDNFVERSTYAFIVQTDLNRHTWCNGSMLSETDLGGGLWESHWQMAGSVPAYLASVTASTYAVAEDEFASAGGNTVPVDLVAAPGDTTDMKNSFAHLQDAFDGYEAWFGPYQWERVGYCSTPQGAMEHPCNISYPTSIIDGSLQYEATMAHELAHMWFGDLITCATAEEMYINEGFAEYLSYLFLERVYGTVRYMDEVRANHYDMLHRAHVTDEGWYALADMPQDFTYGAQTYNKGADVLHTLRSYLGDSLFRAGLTSVLNTYAFKDISTDQLRDQLTATTGVDMTDYFDDWIKQPGWAAFEVDGFSSVPGGGGFVTTVNVQQKLRHADHFYNNVPVTVTCVSSAGALFSSLHPLGGATTTLVINTPFAPAFIWLNYDDRISMAVTAQNDTITATGVQQYNQANFRITVNTLPSTATLRIEEYWVAADEGVVEPFAYVVSPDRYWRITGFIPTGSTMDARIVFNGQPTVSGSFDVGLVQDFGGVAFNEDSMVVLYRSGPGSLWAVVPNATLNTQGSATDGSGRFDFPGFQLGEYTLGWRKSAVTVHEPAPTEQRSWSISPNPAHDHIVVERLGHAVEADSVLQLVDVNGQVIAQQAATARQVVFEVLRLPAQTVSVVLVSNSTGASHLGSVVIE
ncbi:MAG: M1 family metallopeptidase [Flavobacteriales bacterium]